MSARNRGTIRSSAQAAFLTPSWVTASLLKELALPGGKWLEPCAGEGNIIRTVNRKDVTWDAVEIREACTGSLASLDTPGLRKIIVGSFFDPQTLKGLDPHYDVVFTNPPYSLAMEFIQASLAIADQVVLLLRLGMLESGDRAEFWRKNMADIFVLPNRPSFTGSGTDATSYGWYHWPEPGRTHGIIRVLEPVSREARCGKAEK